MLIVAFLSCVASQRYVGYQSSRASPARASPVARYNCLCNMLSTTSGIIALSTVVCTAAFVQLVYHALVLRCTCVSEWSIPLRKGPGAILTSRVYCCHSASGIGGLRWSRTARLAAGPWHGRGGVVVSFVLAATAAVSLHCTAEAVLLLCWEAFSACCESQGRLSFRPAHGTFRHGIVAMCMRISLAVCMARTPLVKASSLHQRQCQIAVPNRKEA